MPSLIKLDLLQQALLGTFLSTYLSIYLSLCINDDDDDDDDDDSVVVHEDVDCGVDCPSMD